MSPSLYYTTTVVLPFTIIERGNQNRQGGSISATKLVAVLVPGGPNLGGRGANSVLHVRTYVAMTLFSLAPQPLCVTADVEGRGWLRRLGYLCHYVTAAVVLQLSCSL